MPLECEQRNKIKRFSIIMPCFNITKSENYIERLFKQTFTSFELIAVNDCSTDDTLSTLLNIQSRNQDFFDMKVINLEKNLGAGGARNVAIKASSGEYLLFLDSDDFLDSNCLEKINEILSKNNVDCLLFDYSTYNKQNKIEHHTFQKSGFISLYNAFIFASNGVSGKCVKRSIIEENNICFLHLKRCEDFPFFRHCFLVSTNIFYLREAFYNYLTNVNSLMHNDELIDVNNAEKAFNYLAKITSDQKLLGILFMKNCFYSNSVAMLETKTNRNDYRMRIKYLKKNYSNYCSIRFLKPYCFRIKCVSFLSYVGFYYLLKISFYFYKRRTRV